MHTMHHQCPRSEADPVSRAPLGVEKTVVLAVDMDAILLYALSR